MHPTVGRQTKAADAASHLAITLCPALEGWRSCYTQASLQAGRW